MSDRYAKSGVDYDFLDKFKRLAQTASAQTISTLKQHSFHEFTASRGESAYVIDIGDRYLAHVEEGLGTKNLVADEVRAFTHRTHYDAIAQDTVAMIVNDLITVGALPFSLAMLCAVGSSDWFEDDERNHDLVEGWKRACLLAGTAWGAGETPGLRGVVSSDKVLLSGSAVGVIDPKERYIKGDIEDGDVIIFFTSSGIHANGLALARSFVEKMPKGYATPVGNGQTYGEALLAPTHIYVPLMKALFEAEIDIHYAANITGHGWRKLMRANTPQPYAYIITELPPPLPIFGFIQKEGSLSDEEMYSTFNMGAGFAVYISTQDASRVLDILRPLGSSLGIKAFTAGYIEKSNEKKVLIAPKGITFAAQTLNIR